MVHVGRASLWVLFCLAVVVLVAPGDLWADRPLGLSVAQQTEAEGHTPPVDAPVIDPFRLPTQPWLAGNRGIEYDTSVGQIVRASAQGVVTFSGPVAGDFFVTIRHSPELRTTVGFVTSVLVAAGETVSQGQPIAVAGESMHFTARLHDEYIDPMLLFRTGRVVVRLVPEPR